MARHIFQACPVWIYTPSNITNNSSSVNVPWRALLCLTFNCQGESAATTWVNEHLIGFNLFSQSIVAEAN
jgi:hypothetical protein